MRSLVSQIAAIYIVSPDFPEQSTLNQVFAQQIIYGHDPVSMNRHNTTAARFAATFVLCLSIFCLTFGQSSESTIIVKIGEQLPILERSVLIQLVERSTATLVQKQYADPSSEIILRGIPFGSYTIRLSSDSLLLAQRNLDVRSTVPVHVTLVAQKEYHADEVVVSEAPGQLASSATSSQTVFTPSVIDQLPAASADKKIESILLSTPGVVPDEDGRMHVRGEDAQLQYVIDGIPITSDLSRVYSSLLNPQIAKAIVIQTGALDAEYGVATSGVLSITSKSGFEEPLFAHGSIQYGSFDGKGTHVEIGGNLRNQSAFFATVSVNETNRYLDPISGFSPIHDYGRSGSAFGEFNTVFGELAQLNVLGMTDHTLYYVPNGTVAGKQDQRQTLNDGLVGARLSVQMSDNSVGSILAYGRSGSALITSGGLEQITNNAEWSQAIAQNEKFFIGGERREQQYGGQFEYSTRYEVSGSSHNVKVGLAGEIYPLAEFLTFAATNPALSDSSIPGGDIRYRVIDITLGGTPFLFNQSKRGARSSAFVQDDMGWGKWRARFGVRFDDFNLLDHESHVSPRVNGVYALSEDLVIRASYNRIVMQAPLENVLVSSSNQARALAGQEQGSTPNRVTSERSHVFELGGTYRLNENAFLELTGYTKFIRNFLVNAELGSSGVIFPVNLKQGFVAGGELRAQVRDWYSLSGSLSFSTCLSEGLRPADGSSPIAAGLILGEEGQNYSHPFTGESSFFTEHNQLLTAVLDVYYYLGHHVNATFAGRFDSGLPFDLTDKNGVGLDAASARAELEQRGYSSDVINMLSLTSDKSGSPDKSVAPHAVFDLGLSADLMELVSVPLTCSATLLNILNTSYLYKFESSFGGTHFGVPRSFLLTLRVDA